MLKLALCDGRYQENFHRTKISFVPLRHWHSKRGYYVYTACPITCICICIRLRMSDSECSLFLIYDFVKCRWKYFIKYPKKNKIFNIFCQKNTATWALIYILIYLLIRNVLISFHYFKHSLDLNKKQVFQKIS